MSAAQVASIYKAMICELMRHRSNKMCYLRLYVVFFVNLTKYLDMVWKNKIELMYFVPIRYQYGLIMSWLSPLKAASQNE